MSVCSQEQCDNTGIVYGQNSVIILGFCVGRNSVIITLELCGGMKSVIIIL